MCSSSSSGQAYRVSATAPSRSQTASNSRSRVQAAASASPSPAGTSSPVAPAHRRRAGGSSSEPEVARVERGRSWIPVSEAVAVMAGTVPYTVDPFADELGQLDLTTITDDDREYVRECIDRWIVLLRRARAAVD